MSLAVWDGFLTVRTQTNEKVRIMKTRILAVALILALAAWLPAVAQQTGTQAAPAADPNAKQATCACCDHSAHHGKDGKSCCQGKDGQPCCDSKSGKEMACCQGHAKGEQSAANCCQGKDGKMCAKDGKDCCAGKDGKSCCGKDAVACNMKDGKDCCGGTDGHCAGCAHS